MHDDVKLAAGPGVDRDCRQALARLLLQPANEDVLNRLRAIGEHGGMERSGDRRATTHNVSQHLLARFWFVPYNTGWHLAHHVDMGIPWRNLPRYHAELVASGYVTDAITYRSYLSLWKAATAASAR